jgi:hypothetical protein
VRTKRSAQLAALRRQLADTELTAADSSAREPPVQPSTADIEVAPVSTAAITRTGMSSTSANSGPAEEDVLANHWQTLETQEFELEIENQRRCGTDQPLWSHGGRVRVDEAVIQRANQVEREGLGRLDKSAVRSLTHSPRKSKSKAKSKARTETKMKMREEATALASLMA